MENNHPEQIPPYIFDWLESHSFSSLATSQQREVLLYFTAEEYDELHHTMADLKKAGRIEKSPGREIRRRELLGHFDKIHAKPGRKISLLNRPVALWKAAAAFLLFGSGILFYQLTAKSTTIVVTQASPSDTVYVTRQVTSDPIRILDTLFLDCPTTPQKANSLHYSAKSDNSVTTESYSGPGDIHVLSLQELEKTANQPKGNSMKDDTLTKHFGFVTL